MRKITITKGNEKIHNTKHKAIDFGPTKKSNMANKLLSTNLELFLRRNKSPLTR